MDLIKALDISSTGLTAQRTKMNIIAENLANAETTRTPEGGPYKRKMVVFETRAMGEFKEKFNDAKKKYEGVRVSEVVESQDDFRLVYNPSHPDADPVSGYVKMPNVDHLTEIADMIVARRTYEANVTAISNTRAMILKAFEIGK